MASALDRATCAQQIVNLTQKNNFKLLKMCFNRSLN